MWVIGLALWAGCRATPDAPPVEPGDVGLWLDGRPVGAVDITALSAYPVAYERREGRAVGVASLFEAGWTQAAVLVAEAPDGSGRFYRHPAQRDGDAAVVLVGDRHARLWLTTARDDHQDDGAPAAMANVARLSLWTAWPGE